MPNDPMFRVVANLYEVVPEVLGKTGKVSKHEGLEGRAKAWILGPHAPRPACRVFATACLCAFLLPDVCR